MLVDCFLGPSVGLSVALREALAVIVGDLDLVNMVALNYGCVRPSKLVSRHVTRQYVSKVVVVDKINPGTEVLCCIL